MHLSPVRNAVLDLLWSAWSELGVPGAHRKHPTQASDPEPLIVFTPSLAPDDPRLLEQAAAWCERHGDLVSKTRLAGLQRMVPREVSDEFTAFTGRLGGAAGDWGPVRSMRTQLHSVRATMPPLERPALARLRARVLAGTGTRADVLCELIGSLNAWTSATDLERLGYSRRSIARVLSDLAAARLTTERAGKGPAAFRLREPLALIGLIAAQNVEWPDWAAILTLAWRLSQLERSKQPSGALAPVKARDEWDELRRLSVASGLREPPISTGDSSAWQNLMNWGSAALRLWPAPATASTVG
jgi:hypothetical protein